MKHIVNAFAILLLLLVGTVFVSAPAGLLYNLMNGWMGMGYIVAAIFIYYILATLLPIDKIIGRFYPIFGLLLIISALGVGGGLLFTGAPIPELTLANLHPAKLPIFPLLFLTISCGALSGFHATQTPIISRTTQNEKQGRKIFYGMMIAEGIVAMIWAAAGMSLFNGPIGLNELLAAGGPAMIVSEASVLMLGAIGGTLAILGVIILPITSGDTAFRSARMIIADYFKLPQLKMMSRVWIALPLFAISIALTKVDFNILWRYFSWANQSTAVIALFVAAMYLFIAKKNYWIALIPGVFMLMATMTYILNAQIGFRLPMDVALIGATVISIILVLVFFNAAVKARAQQIPLDSYAPDWDETTKPVIP